MRFMVISLSSLAEGLHNDKRLHNVKIISLILNTLHEDHIVIQMIQICRLQQKL